MMNGMLCGTSVVSHPCENVASVYRSQPAYWCGAQGCGAPSRPPQDRMWRAAIQTQALLKTGETTPLYRWPHQTLILTSIHAE